MTSQNGQLAGAQRSPSAAAHFTSESTEAQSGAAVWWHSHPEPDPRFSGLSQRTGKARKLPVCFRGVPCLQDTQTSAPRPALQEGVCTNYLCGGISPAPRTTCAVDRLLLGAPSPVDACFILPPPPPRVPRNQFSLFFSVCVCLCGSQVLPCIVHPLHQPLLSSPPPRPLPLRPMRARGGC